MLEIGETNVIGITFAGPDHYYSAVSQRAFPFSNPVDSCRDAMQDSVGRRIAESVFHAPA